VIEVPLFLADFHDAIAVAVPQIVELLNHQDWSVRFVGTNAMEKLFEHGQ